jgi:peptide/nickel transport system substrate-binding protein
MPVPTKPLIATVGAILLTAACSSAGGSTDAAGPPVSGGKLRFAVDGNLECLDPHQSPTELSALLSRPIVDSLVSRDAKGTIAPWLATSWTVSDDQKTYTFKLRDGVRFTNGEALDAAAVKANLDHVVNPATKSLLAAQSIVSYASSRVVDAHTVEVQLKQPASSFLPALAAPYLGIEAPGTLADNAGLCKKIVGTGPFVSETGYVSQRGIEYTRNNAYNSPAPGAAHQGQAYLDAISVQVITENAARVGALTSGQLDGAAAIPPVNVAALKAGGAYTAQVVPAPGVGYSYFPNTELGVFSDRRVREAFRLGVDWKLIVSKLFFNVYQPPSGPLSSATTGYDRSVAPAYVYDPQRAATLLDEAGWTGRDAEGYRTRDGKRLTAVRMFVPGKDNATLTSQIQAAAKQLGLQIADQPVDVGTFVKRDIAGDYDVVTTNVSSTTPDVLRVVFGSANIASPQIGVGNNVSRYRNPVVDDAVNQALATTDPAKQAEFYARAQQQITADAAVIPVYEKAYILGTSVKLHGVSFAEQTFPSFYDAWLGK